MSTALIVSLIITLTILVLGGSLYWGIARWIRQLSRLAFGTTNILKGFQQMEQELEKTPLSVGGATDMYLSRILKDFPDFHRQTIEESVKQFLTQYYNSLEQGNINLLDKTKITDNVRAMLRSEIADLSNRPVIDRVKVHKMAISHYSKGEDLATVRYQVSSEYYDGVKFHQLKHEVDLSYLFEAMDQTSFALNCRNCGAPLKKENTVCAYCGTAVIRNIGRLWWISNYRELKRV